MTYFDFLIDLTLFGLNDFLPCLTFMSCVDEALLFTPVWLQLNQLCAHLGRCCGYNLRMFPKHVTCRRLIFLHWVLTYCHCHFAGCLEMFNIPPKPHMTHSAVQKSWASCHFQVFCFQGARLFYNFLKWPQGSSPGFLKVFRSFSLDIYTTDNKWRTKEKGVSLKRFTADESYLKVVYLNHTEKKSSKDLTHDLREPSGS